ncbi:potassium-transporting ATPase subunit KdpC [Lysinibacter cavernae]|uniref:Potassium-transporting ATPase KdpC subunit n=1 Tax=Lysinibacter cavernae TaxID=1640652 RepID=A0A7X5TUL4_9MICO|nr:potassium-transporting ATPase subunit KdpC [Lysinibacter cavernae]NIH54684.1 K+-transporting ATPase ATPase C chain [Lysinibacter cavernae]
MPNRVARKVAPLWTALRLMLILTVVLGVGYPLVVFGIGVVAFPGQAEGSYVRDADDQVAGSSLIGQRFDAADGSPLPEYFQPRPSLAGDGYDPLASGGSNLGPESPELIAQIQERRAQVAAFNGVPEADVPVDAVTASGSGLDPDISVEYARLQVPRVASARGLPVADVAALVEESITGRDAGFIGEPRVNVVGLNLALDGLG